MFERMEKKTKTIIAVVIVIAVIAVSVFSFCIINQEKQEDPLKNLEYVNIEEQFGLNPPEGWTLDEHKDDPFVVTLEISYPTDNLSSFMNVYITATSPSLNKTLDEQVNNFLENYFPRFEPENFSMISHNERTVNDMEAYEFKFIMHNFSIYYTIKAKYIFVEKNSRLFNINYWGTLDLYDMYESVVEQSLDTLVII